MENSIGLGKEIHKLACVCVLLDAIFLSAYLAKGVLDRYWIVSFDFFYHSCFVFILPFLVIQFGVYISLLIGKDSWSQVVISLVNIVAMIILRHQFGFGFYYNKPIGFVIGLAVTMSLFMMIVFTVLMLLFQMLELLVFKELKLFSSSPEFYKFLFEEVEDYDDYDDYEFEEDEGEE